MKPRVCITLEPQLLRLIDMSKGDSDRSGHIERLIIKGLKN